MSAAKYFRVVWNPTACGMWLMYGIYGHSWGFVMAAAHALFETLSLSWRDAA